MQKSETKDERQLSLLLVFLKKNSMKNERTRTMRKFLLNEDLLDDVEVEEVADDDINDSVFGRCELDDYDYDARLCPVVTLKSKSIQEFNDLVEYAGKCIYEVFDSSFGIYKFSKFYPCIECFETSTIDEIEIGNIIYKSYYSLERINEMCNESKPGSMRIYIFARLKCKLNCREIIRLCNDFFDKTLFAKYRDSLEFDALYVSGNTNKDSTARLIGFGESEYKDILLARNQNYKGYVLFTSLGKGSFGQFIVNNEMYNGYYDPFSGDNYNFRKNVDKRQSDILMKSNADVDRVLYVIPEHDVKFVAYYDENQKLVPGYLRSDPGVELDVLQDICDKTTKRIEKNRTLVKVVLHPFDVYHVFGEKTMVLYIYLRGTVFNSIKEYATVLCIADSEHTEGSIMRMINFVRDNLVVSKGVFKMIVDDILYNAATYVEDDLIDAIRSKISFYEKRKRENC